MVVLCEFKESYVFQDLDLEILRDLLRLISRTEICFEVVTIDMIDLSPFIELAATSRDTLVRSTQKTLSFTLIITVVKCKYYLILTFPIRCLMGSQV